MYAKMAPKMFQNRAWGRLGASFEVLGGFWRMSIFDEFGGCKKSTKNDKSSTFGTPKIESLVILGRVGE